MTFNELGIDLKGATSGTKKVVCPICAQRKGGTMDKDLSVNISDGLYNCHNSHCNFKGRLSTKTYKRPDFVKNVSGVPRDLAVFFQSRGISQQTIKDEQITYSNGDIYFNYFKDESLVNYKKRNIKEKKFSQFAEAEKCLYRRDSLIGKTKCIITEGEIDALTFVEMGLSSEYAIVSIDQGANRNGSLDGKLECITNAAHLLNSVSEFYLAGDNDEAGEYTFKEIGRRLGEYRCKKVDFGKDKDANEKLLRLMASGMSTDVCQETFRKLIYNSEPLPVLGIIPLDDKLIEEMIDQYHNGLDQGIGVGGEIDTLWTVLDGEITLFTGYPSDGKSQTLRYIAVLHAIRNGLKFACYCVEDNPASYFYSDLAKIYMGKPIDKKFSVRASEIEYRSALNYIRDKFYYIHPEPDPVTGMYPVPSNDWINEKISFLKLQYGVNAYIKDPWNKIYHNVGTREDLYLSNELSSEKMFAANYKACFYVHHPTGQVDRDREGNLKAPTQFKLSGGAMFNNMFDNIIIVFRPEREIDPKSRRVQWIVKKIKKQGIRGGEGTVEMNFSRINNRYETPFDDMGFPTQDKETTETQIDPFNFKRGDYDFDSNDIPF